MGYDITLICNRIFKNFDFKKQSLSYLVMREIVDCAMPAIFPLVQL